MMVVEDIIYHRCLVGLSLVSVKTTAYYSHYFHTHQPIQQPLVSDGWEHGYNGREHFHQDSNVSPLDKDDHSEQLLYRSAVLFYWSSESKPYQQNMVSCTTEKPDPLILGIKHSTNPIRYICTCLPLLLFSSCLWFLHRCPAKCAFIFVTKGLCTAVLL